MSCNLFSCLKNLVYDMIMLEIKWKMCNSNLLSRMGIWHLFVLVLLTHMQLCLLCPMLSISMWWLYKICDKKLHLRYFWILVGISSEHECMSVTCLVWLWQFLVSLRCTVIWFFRHGFLDMPHHNLLFSLFIWDFQIFIQWYWFIWCCEFLFLDE